MNLKEHVVLKWCIFLFRNSPASLLNLLDNFLAEFFSLLLLKDNHVVSCLAVYAGLVLKKN